jgi:hypothetical protein
MTRAPSDLAILIEPSVEPLSATTTSPRTPSGLRAAFALLTQRPTVPDSFRDGITIEKLKF